MATEKKISLIEAKAILKSLSIEIESEEGNENIQKLFCFLEQEEEKRTLNETYFK